MTSFTDKQNIQMLWDVLLDEIGVDKNNLSIIKNIRFVFEQNINIFSAKVNPSISLIEKNKHFLRQMVVAINKLFPNIKNSQQKRIQISNEIINDQPYKIEDIQQIRQNNFEQEYEKRQNDFNYFMNKEKPKEIDLSDKFSEEKISSMDELLAERLAERELDIQDRPDPITETLLQPIQTNTKKQPQNDYMNTNINNNGNKLKYLQLDTNSNNLTLNIKELAQQDKKKVSFSEELIDTNIFSKLKKIPEPNINTNNEYVEQFSAPLPEVKKEQPVKQQINIVQQQEPMISTNQMIKQINELTNKINIIDDKINKILDIVSLLLNNNNLPTQEDN